jgi:CheY-like chemotaxis protein
MTVGTEAGRPLRVLVADDDRDAADSLAILLRLWEHDARACHGGREAVECAHAFRPDCLFLDINMPRVNGYEVAERVRRDPALRHARLVALTAHADEADTLRPAAGFDHHLMKPGSLAEIGQILASVSSATRTGPPGRQAVDGWPASLPH